MKITQPEGMHPALYRAICAVRGVYDPGNSDFTVTQLLKPPQVVALERQHGDTLEESADSLGWAIGGSALHVLTQQGAGPGDRVEERVYVERMGVKIGGQFDLFSPDQGELIDWKELSVYEAKHGPKKDREQQLNLLAHLLREAEGVTVSSLLIIGRVRDWRPAESKREQGYPPSQFVQFEIPLWDHDKCETFLMDRLAQHMSALHGDVRPCTSGERWSRNGRPVRCLEYCVVRDVCPQFQEQQ